MPVDIAKFSVSLPLSLFSPSFLFLSSCGMIADDISRPVAHNCHDCRAIASFDARGRTGSVITCTRACVLDFICQTTKNGLRRSTRSGSVVRLRRRDCAIKRRLQARWITIIALFPARTMRPRFAPIFLPIRNSFLSYFQIHSGLP